MSKIVFLKDPNTIYDGKFTQIGTNQARLVFTDGVLPEEEILLSGFNLINEHNGRIQTKRADYIYIYRIYDDGKTIELCNDNIPYVTPDRTVKFNMSFGGVLNGEIEQIVKDYKDLIIPTVQTEEGYEFVEWTPSIPTEGEINRNITFYAIIVDKNIYFHTSGGGSLDGEIKQAVNNYSELEIPTPIVNENYTFVKWMPEIPSDGEIDIENTSFYAVFEDNTIERLSSIENELGNTQLAIAELYEMVLLGGMLNG